jgi:hypothetical protein
MATVTKGRTFTSGETVTPAKLNDVVDLATVTEIVNADIKSDAAIAGTKIDPLVEVGTYTPTITGVTNVASISPLEFQYMRVGPVVTVSGFATLGFTTAGTSAELTISIPVASAFTSTSQCSGVMAISTPTSNRGYGAVSAITLGDARARIYPEHIAARGYSIHFTYRII